MAEIWAQSFKINLCVIFNRLYWLSKSIGKTFQNCVQVKAYLIEVITTSTF